jgi:hypothetical protein
MRNLLIFGLIACGLLTKARAELNTGLVAYFPFNGNALDATGNGYDGVVHGAVLTQDRFSNFNSAYLFNGTNNFIQVSKLFPNLTNLTVSAWVQYTSGSYQNGTGIILDDSDTTASNDFEFGVRDATDVIIVATNRVYPHTECSLGQEHFRSEGESSAMGSIGVGGDGQQFHRFHRRGFSLHLAKRWKQHRASCTTCNRGNFKSEPFCCLLWWQD